MIRAPLLLRPLRALGLAGALGLLVGAGPAAAGARDDLEALLGATPAWSQGAAGPPPDGRWWAGLGDPTLTAAIDKALSENNDLLASFARVDQARARQRTALSAVLPQLSFDAQATAAPRESLGFQFGLNQQSNAAAQAAQELVVDTDGDGVPDAPDPAAVAAAEAAAKEAEEEASTLFWNGSAKFNATWNLDLWGRNLQSFQASRMDEAAARGDRDAAAIALVTAVAAAWSDLVTAEARRALLARQVEINRQMLELVQLRFTSAQSSGLDVLQQQQQLASAEALVPAVEQGVERAIVRMATLLGQDPVALRSSLRPAAALPALPAQPALGAPKDLLRNRPDLAAALAQAEAAEHRAKSATRALLPTVGLNANAGWQGNDISEEWQSQQVWGFGGSVSVPLFTGLRTLGGLQDAKAGQVAASFTLRQRALAAVAEVEDALLAEQQAAAELAALRRLTEAARLAFEDSRDRYGRGLVNYTTVLQALTVYQSAELQALNAHRNLIGARINLHDALGGAWPQALRAAPEDLR